MLAVVEVKEIEERPVILLLKISMPKLRNNTKSRDFDILQMIWHFGFHQGGNLIINLSKCQKSPGSPRSLPGEDIEGIDKCITSPCF